MIRVRFCRLEVSPVQTEESFKNLLKAEAQKNAPHESCGFVFEDFTIYPCKNMAPDPRNYFLINPDDFDSAKAIKKVIGVYHSHPFGAAIHSELDKKNSEDTFMDSYLYSLEEDKVSVYKPMGYKQSLVRRDFCYGISDCWILVQDYYDTKLGIKMNINPPRTNEHDIISKNLIQNVLIPSLINDYGFSIIKDGELKKYDILIMKMNSSVPNHVAMYLEDNLILHALKDRGYCQTFYGNHFKNKTICKLRHPQFY